MPIRHLEIFASQNACGDTLLQLKRIMILLKHYNIPLFMIPSAKFQNPNR